MIENRTFEKISFTDTVFEDEYYNCTFISCDFSNVIFRQTDFDRCTFSTCNLSMSKFKNALRNISFIDCKMTGVDFSEINRFSSDLIFENSHLDYGNFVAVKLQKTIFRNCKMYETFFDNALIKAKTISLFLREKGISAPVYADDSGEPHLPVQIWRKSIFRPLLTSP